jgi:putative ABC transport system permease protein
MHALLKDVSHAVRRLTASPALTALSVITLGLGIGATTAMYAVVDALMLRPLPYPDPDRLAEVAIVNPAGITLSSVSPEQVRVWRDGLDVFETLEGYATRGSALTGAGEPETIVGASLSGGLMTMLGVRAAVGRVLDDADARHGRLVVVLSDALWRARFGADPAAIDEHQARRHDARIVGVMPPAFSFPYARRQFWVPLHWPPRPPHRCAPPRSAACAAAFARCGESAHRRRGSVTRAATRRPRRACR